MHNILVKLQSTEVHLGVYAIIVSKTECYSTSIYAAMTVRGVVIRSRIELDSKYMYKYPEQTWHSPNVY